MVPLANSNATVRTSSKTFRTKTFEHHQASHLKNSNYPLQPKSTSQHHVRHRERDRRTKPQVHIIKQPSGRKNLFDKQPSGKESPDKKPNRKQSTDKERSGKSDSKVMNGINFWIKKLAVNNLLISNLTVR